MAEATDIKVQIIQNLKDAGCADELITKFMHLCQSGKTEEQLRILSSHRKNLLEAVHENQKRIDCLDYLIYKMKSGQSPESSG